jgi:hypothetical protein
MQKQSESMELLKKIQQLLELVFPTYHLESEAENDRAFQEIWH